MAEKANVANIERLEQFRSSLVVFLEKASIILNEVNDEVKRTRIWLQSEQKLRLNHEMKRKERDMEMLQQELFSARISSLNESKTGHKMRMNKLRREIRELENTMRAVSAWLRNFDSKVEIESRKVDKLRSVLDNEMGSAVMYLAEASKALKSYTE